jgi:hypothetical protein
MIGAIRLPSRNQSIFLLAFSTVIFSVQPADEFLAEPAKAAAAMSD